MYIYTLLEDVIDNDLYTICRRALQLTQQITEQQLLLSESFRAQSELPMSSYQQQFQDQI